MNKKIAVINDLSGFGRCSLTAAISVLSAMGAQPCPLPTAILTAQTGFPHYYCDDYTDKMEIFRKEWADLGATFDGIYTGFVASEPQIREIFRFLDTFDSSGTFLLVDPVMGDDGIPYDFFTPTLSERMRDLALRADLITPNVTELCLLTGQSYGDVLSIDNTGKQLQTLTDLGRALIREGPRTVVVTGIRFTDETRVRQMGNLYLTKTDAKLFSFPYVGGSYSGTGDLFAACLVGGLARGDAVCDTIQMAGNFLEQSLSDSVRAGVPEVEGVNYEKYLHLLMR